MANSTHQIIVRDLRNTRDLRARILTLAAELATAPRSTGRLVVIDPAITTATIRKEWRDHLPALATEVRARMALQIEQADPVREIRDSAQTTADLLPLERPNYRHEVLRLLLAASLENTQPPSVKQLVEHIGVSQTPIREALAELKQAGLVHASGRGVGITTGDLSNELLAKLRALPQTLRFRFERGARIKSPAELVHRAEPLLGPDGPVNWQLFALSGTPVAQRQVSNLDLVGTPRLDLLANIPRGDKDFDARILRLLDDGLEPEPNVLAPAPVVLTLVRANPPLEVTTNTHPVRQARSCDVFLSLLDMGLRAQALHYAQALAS